MLKKISCFLMAGLLIIPMAACADGTVTLEDQTFEYGERYTIPNYENDLGVKVVDSEGNEIKVVNGVFKPEVDTYSIEITKDGKLYTYNLSCQDTIAPSVSFNYEIQHVSRGELVGLPLFVKEDASVIDEEKVVLSVKNDKGEAVTYQKNTDITNRYDYYVDTKVDNSSTYYVVEISVEDPYGNVGTDTCTIYIHDEYISTTAANVLYSFDDVGYTNLVYTMEKKENFTATITSEYPEKEDVVEGNKVLKLTSDANYEKVYTSLVFPKNKADFRFSNAYKILVSVCTDRDIEWVKIENWKGKVGGSVHQLKANEWRTIEVDPILMGYALGDEDSKYNQIVITSRTNYNDKDEIGINLYVDDIQFIPNELAGDYVPNQETFDSESYLSRVYQNEYLDNETRTNPNREYQASSSEFSIEEKYFEGESKPRKVLKVTTTAQYGGMVYMLPERVHEDQIDQIVITMSHEYEMQRMYVGVLQADYTSGNYREILEMGSIKTLNKYSLNGDRIANGYNSTFTGIDSHVTGIWFACKDDTRTGNVFYIDSIEIILK